MEHTGGVSHVVFGTTGQRLYSASSAKRFCEWDAVSGKLLRQMTGGKAGVSRLAVDAAGDLVLAAHSRIRVLDLASGKKTKRLTGHPATIDCLVVTPDSKCVVTGAADRFLNFWTLSTEDGDDGSSPVCGLAVDGQAVACSTAVAPSDVGYFVLAVVDNGAVDVWHVDSDAKGTQRCLCMSANLVVWCK